MEQRYSDIISKIKERPLRKVNDEILLVDGMNMLIRSFSVIKTMNPDGSHIGAISGFLRSLNYVTRIVDPTRVVVVWDGKGGSGSRKNLNPNYKAQRSTAKITHWGLYDTKEQEQEALIGQLYRVIDYLKCLPVQEIMMEKLEADDIIAFIAKLSSEYNKKATIVSSDQDFLQLIDKNVSIYSPIKKTFITYKNVEQHIKVLAQNYNIVKSILGDKSDNVDKVKGVGIKTLISEFPLLKTKKVNLEYIYQTCEQEIQKEKHKKIFAKILVEWDKVETNYKVMDLHQTMLSSSEIEHVLEALLQPIPELRVATFLHMLEQDQIESITKNTESWLENFRGLTVFGK